MSKNQESIGSKSSLPIPGSAPKTPEAVGELPATIRAITFEELAAGGKEVLVHHNAQVYRLRCTKNGKLILNK